MMMKRTFIAIIYLAIIGIIQPSFATTVTLMAKLNGAKHPSIVGTTNLPEGTKLATDLVCPLKYCKEFSLFESTATVHGGIFVSEPLKTNGYKIPEDGYGINVVVLSEIGGQSPEVISKLKAFGWDGLTPISFHFDSPPKDLQALFSNPTDISKFTPPQFTNAALDNGWMELGENESSKYWYSYWIDRQMNGVAVVLKGADKGIGNNFTTIHFISGYADCLRSRGTYPSYLNMTREETLDARSGNPIPGMAGDIVLGNVALSRGLVLSEAVKQSCDRANASASR